MPDRDDGRRAPPPPPTPGAVARRELWPPRREDEEEADRLGTTRALAKPADPRVTTALGVDPETAEPAARLPAVLVLVQWLYLAVERLVEGVNAIRSALAREPTQPAWAAELASALPRLEQTVGGLPDTEVVRGLREDLQGVVESVATVTRRFDRAEAPRAPSGPPPAPQPRELPAEVRDALGRIDAALKTLTEERAPQSDETAIALRDLARRMQSLEGRFGDLPLATTVGAVRGVVDRIEQALATGGQAGTVGAEIVGLKAQLGRMEVVLAQRSAGGAAATSRPPRWVLVAAVVMTAGAMLSAGAVWYFGIGRPTPAPVLVSPQPNVMPVLQALRVSNAALAARVEKVVRCGHEECLRSALNAETGKWDRTQCQWVVEHCPDLPRQAP